MSSDSDARNDFRAKEKLARFLRDIVEYGEAAREAAAAASFERFVTDRDLRHLVYYRVQCVSEAVRNVLALDPGIAERAPEIPWRSIRADVAALLAVARREIGRLDA